MTTGSLPVVWQPAFVEEVVLRAIVGRPEERAFRRARNPLYLLAEDERDRAFAELHAAWFAQLGLDQPLRTALAELPIVAQGCARCAMHRALTRDDEGADLLVASEPDGHERTVLVRLRTTTFDDAEQLLALLRAELLHVADMLDPAFGYTPSLPVIDGGPSHERLVRDRYRALWNVSVAGRLTRRDVAGPDAETQAHRAFAAVFPMLGADADAAFRRVFTGAVCTHADLMAFAAAPRMHDASRGLGPGGRCPLCRFPTYASEPAPESLPIDVVADIVADFPAWQPADGLCSQCAELYRARQMSMAAAAALPGV